MFHSAHSADLRNPYGKSYQWPSSLYKELSQISECAFLAVVLGYLSQATRNAEGEEDFEFDGLQIDKRGNLSKPTNSTTKSLLRNFTPTEVKRLILDNDATLLQLNLQEDRHRGTGDSLSMDEELLSQMSLRLEEMEKPPTDATNLRAGFRAYTFEELDDNHCFQQKNVCYGVVRDRHHKRITLVFRGTPEENLGSELNATMKTVPMPEILKRKIERSNDDKQLSSIGVHPYFHESLFSTSRDGDENNNTTMFDQIRKDVKGIMQKFPGYKLYVTGHSAGAGLSTMASFYLCLEKEIPKPITCINFASPRVGSKSFVQACQFLEKNCQLRIARVVMEGDPMTVIPERDYEHAGLQITLQNSETEECAPDLSYPQLDSMNVPQNILKCLQTIIPGNFDLNLNECHLVDYMETLDIPEVKEFLDKYDLNGVYQNEDLVGFELIPLGVKFAIPAASTFGS